MVRTAALIALTLSSAAIAQSPRAQYKNATLGITLDEWKALPFPGEGQATIHCSDEPNSDLLVPINADDKTAGVVACGYYSKVSSVGGRRFGFDAAVPIGANQKTRLLNYAFYRGRLFRIIGRAPISASADMIDGLKARFGAPAEVANSTTRNGFGAAIPQAQYSWNVGTDKIVLQAPSGKIDQASFVYLDTAADQAVAAARESADPSSSKM